MFSSLAPDLAGPTKKNQALEFVVSALRMHFGRSVLDDAPEDAEKWNMYADRLYEKIETSRRTRGLTTDVQSVCGGAMQFTYFEYVSDYLAGQTGGHSFSIWGPSGARNANGHFREMPMVFNFGHPSVHKLYNQDMLGSSTNPEDQAMSKILMGALSSFAKTKQPSVPELVPELEWLPFPHNMHLKIKPVSKMSDAGSRGGQLHISFTAMRAEMISDFGIEENVIEQGNSRSLNVIELGTLPHLIGTGPDQKSKHT